MPDGWNNDTSPFHAGEQQVQERLGVRDIEDWARKVVRPYLPEEHRAFHTAMPFLVAAARDAEGRPWPTLLAGREGFVTSPDPESLVIAAKPAPGDALEGALANICCCLFLIVILRPISLPALPRLMLLALFNEMPNATSCLI